VPVSAAGAGAGTGTGVGGGAAASGRAVSSPTLIAASALSARRRASGPSVRPVRGEVLPRGELCACPPKSTW